MATTETPAAGVEWPPRLVVDPANPDLRPPEWLADLAEAPQDALAGPRHALVAAQAAEAVASGAIAGAEQDLLEAVMRGGAKERALATRDAARDAVARAGTAIKQARRNLEAVEQRLVGDVRSRKAAATQVELEAIRREYDSLAPMIAAGQTALAQAKQLRAREAEAADRMAQALRDIAFGAFSGKPVSTSGKWRSIPDIDSIGLVNVVPGSPPLPIHDLAMVMRRREGAS